MSKLLKILSMVFLILFIITVIYNKYESNRAEENSKRLLSYYLSESTSCEASTEIFSEVSSEISSEGTTEKISEISTDNFPISISSDSVIGILTIPSISLHLPVINHTTDELLNISLCRYNSVNIGEDGNIVICGHNYINGAHFGNLSKVNINDSVVLSDKKGNSYSYTVYETEMIMPTEVEKVEKYIGGKNLTMFTCDATGRKRFVVRCKEN